MTIFTLALRGIRASLGRLALTTVAILAGVGFVSGAFILADSLESTFGSLFEDANAETDAQIVVAELEFGNDLRTIPDTLVTEVEALPEVGRAVPQISLEDNFAPFVALDENGEEVVPQGPPVVTFSWEGEEGGGLALASGAPPSGIDQTAIDLDYAAALDVGPGDIVTFNTPNGQRDFEIAGIVEFDVTAGAYFVLFDFESAQTLYDKEGVVDAIALQRAQGVATTDMIAAVEEVVPEEADVLNQAELIEDATADFELIITVFRTILLVFAGIALFVSLFIIYNTFAILVAQRMRQIGMLRALGATRPQVGGWLLIEALLVGLVGSILGLLAGFGVAFLIKALFQAAGGFPETDTVLRLRTVYVAFGVGVVATLASALVPAVLASLTSPIAAMRPERPASGLNRRVVVGLVVFFIGAVLMGLGLAGQTSGFTVAGVTISTAWVIGLEFGLGGIMVFLGMFLFSVLFAGQVVDFLGKSSILGTAMAGLGLALIVAIFAIGDGVPGAIDGFGDLLGWISFVAKLAVAGLSITVGIMILTGKSGGGRIEGHLARRNAARSPVRTAATATALTIGIALVSTVGVVGESIKASLTDTLDQAVKADLFIFDEAAQSPFSAELADEVETVDGVSAVSRFRVNEIRLGEDVETMAAYNADTGASIINYDVSEGTTDGLADNGVLVFRDVADERQLSVGDTVAVEFPDLESEDLTVTGIFEDNSVLNSPWIIDLSVYERHIQTTDDIFVGAAIADDADPAQVKADVAAVTDTYSSVTTQDNQEFLDSQEGQVDGLVSLINYMLGFALFVAFLGVINTIVLSVVERTREIGLLRAVGTTQRQVRAMVRWEAVIVCLFGALLGIALGVLFGFAAVSAVPDDIIGAIAVPYESVIFTILVAALAGVMAAVVPAYLAAKRDVLEAVATVE